MSLEIFKRKEVPKEIISNPIFQIIEDLGGWMEIFNAAKIGENKKCNLRIGNNVIDVAISSINGSYSSDMSLSVKVNPHIWKEVAEKYYDDHLLIRDTDCSDRYVKIYDDDGSLESLTIEFDDASGKLFIADWPSENGSGYHIYLDYGDI